MRKGAEDSVEQIGRGREWGEGGCVERIVGLFLGIDDGDNDVSLKEVMRENGRREELGLSCRFWS